MPKLAEILAKKQAAATTPPPSEVAAPATPRREDVEDAGSGKAQAPSEPEHTPEEAPANAGTRDAMLGVAPGSFPEESPAQDPLPASLNTQEAREFRTALDKVPELYDQPEMIKGIFEQVMHGLAANPHWIQLLQPTDAGQLLRAGRQGLGLAQVKKNENRQKAGSRKKKVTAGMAEMDSLVADLGAIGDIQLDQI